MKRVLYIVLLLLPCLVIGQIQIGADINGESSGDFSGESVSLSCDGTILAIGAPFNDENGPESGHVRVYENSNGSWVQIGEDIDGEMFLDFSGESVSLSCDGTVLAIGASGNDGMNGSNSGHVRVYENSNGFWVQVGEDIDGEAANDSFGSSVSLSSDGSILAIGAPFNDNNPGSGHVRVYENNNGSWVQIGEDIDDSQVSGFGSSVSLSSDGSFLAIGAPIGLEERVRIFKNENGSWVQIGNDINGETNDENFGIAVSLSSDGSIVAIGANRFSNNRGYVKIFRIENDLWVQIGETILGEAEMDGFGLSISLSADGSVVVIGALGNDANGSASGHARIFKNENDSWVQVGNDIEGEVSNDNLGFGVSISPDASTVAVGVRGDDSNGSNAGTVKVFDISELLNVRDFNSSLLTMYPNPTSNQITLQLNNEALLKKANLYNELGQLVLSTNSRSINVSTLSTGVYFINIITDQGTENSKLIIK